MAAGAANSEPPRVTLRETTAADLPNIKSLWNDGDVMKFVGFPDGLGITNDELDSWLVWVIDKRLRCHYSIYADEVGYCGEAFYDVNPDTSVASLDIKLLPVARGKGIAKQALSFAIDQAFGVGGAAKCYVDPNLANLKARALYEKLGFKPKPHPPWLATTRGLETIYLEISKTDWAGGGVD